MSILLLIFILFTYLSQSNTSTSIYFVNLPSKGQEHAIAAQLPYSENPFVNFNKQISFFNFNFNQTKPLIQVKPRKIPGTEERIQHNNDIRISEKSKSLNRR